ncbi:MAG: hypothetical protein BWY82_01946 [Verrucomicrobia bacterium ADurb.Bin474]|nr:MAG: hypothetical protein BWY82_01946 [Verrucomicrobia bacterium ADurb.Bin474]
MPVFQIIAPALHAERKILTFRRKLLEGIRKRHKTTLLEWMQVVKNHRRENMDSKKAQVIATAHARHPQILLRLSRGGLLKHPMDFEQRAVRIEILSTNSPEEPDLTLVRRLHSRNRAVLGKIRFNHLGHAVFLTRLAHENVVRHHQNKGIVTDK